MATSGGSSAARASGRRTQTLGAIPDIVDRERGRREREQRVQSAGHRSQSRTLDAQAAPGKAEQKGGKMKIDSSVLRALQGSGGCGGGGGGQAAGAVLGRAGSASPQPGTSGAAAQRSHGHTAPGGHISEPVTRVTVSMAAASSAPRTPGSTRTTSTSPTPGPAALTKPRGAGSIDSRGVRPLDQRPLSIASDNSVSVNVSDERQLLPSNNRNSGGDAHAQINTSGINPGVSLNRFETNEALPDILNSHLLPPYASVRQNQSRSARQGPARGARGQGGRHGRATHSRRRAPASTGPVTQLEGGGGGGLGKGCCTRDTCLDCVTVVTTFRWVLVSLAMLGVCCVVTGIILGALHMTIGNSFLTLSLMFIGLGVMLVVVVGVGWRCTPHGHEPCHLLFNLGDHSSRTTSRGHRSSRPHRDRNGWYGGVLYPEFRHRRPPPSYNASMQEYQQQIIMAQIQQGSHGNNNTSGSAGEAGEAGGSTDNLSLPSSPPPTYRSRASSTRPGLHITFPAGDCPSGPPTYRSHVSDAGVTTRSRPPLPMSDSASTSDDNTLDARAVHVTIETHAGPPTVSSSAHSTLGTSRDTSRHASRHTTPPRGGDDSTLNRAAQVVQYLDNILLSEGAGDSTDTATSRSNTPSAATSRKSSVDYVSAHKPIVTQPVTSTTAISTSMTSADGASAPTAQSSTEKTANAFHNVCKASAEVKVGEEDDDDDRIIADTPL